MSKKAMPKSKAKTAYGLLSEIRRLILEEPERYDQNQYLLTKEAFSWKFEQPSAPACGTIGCVAGWTCALKGLRWPRNEAVLDQARIILGVDEAAATSLFRFDAVPLRSPSLFEKRVTPQRHARLGARHIAKFQKKYAAQLKAKRV